MKIILFCYALMVLLLTSGCTHINNPSKSIITEVQKDTPFNIVVPSYFPKGINNLPFGIGKPTLGVGLDESVVISVTYGSSKKDKIIHIVEENLEYIFEPSNSPSTRLNINNSLVIEEETSVEVFDQQQNGESVVSGFLYRWNRDGVSYQVSVFGCARDECRRVVQSMLS